MPRDTENIYFASILEDDDGEPTYHRNERCGDVEREEVSHLLDDTDTDPDELDGYLTFWG
jgi:hypothetical protein